ncbi:MAG TPA: PDZ domain-containing protein, partial [Kofleriaceae bacterium]|nr:PDZ domain-containing protein [Kofleriaceae bacterium]
MTLPRRAFLGAELPPDEEAFTGEGVRIAGVLEDGMAVRAKLVAGDIVVAIAERPVRDFCELASALRAAGAARRVSVAFLRAGERLSRTVETVPAPRDPAFSYGELAVGGARVRTFATRVEQPRALVVIIQGIACESV